MPKSLSSENGDEIQPQKESSSFEIVEEEEVLSLPLTTTMETSALVYVLLESGGVSCNLWCALVRCIYRPVGRRGNHFPLEL